MSMVMAPDASTTGTRTGQGAALPSRLTTTLYDVLAAIQDGVGPEDDARVVAMVVHLLRSGQLTWLQPDRVRRGAAQRAVGQAAWHLSRH